MSSARQQLSNVKTVLYIFDSFAAMNSSCQNHITDRIDNNVDKHENSHVDVGRQQQIGKHKHNGDDKNQNHCEPLGKTEGQKLMMNMTFVGEERIAMCAQTVDIDPDNIKTW